MQLIAVIVILVSIFSAQSLAKSPRNRNQEDGGDGELDGSSSKRAERFSFESLLGDSLYMWGQERTEDSAASIFEAPTSDLLQNKPVVAVYFSASWCPPCRQFTPMLVKLYNAVNKKKPNSLEVVWVSGDRSQDDFVEYFRKMPWLAVSLGNLQSVTQQLHPRYGVRGIPHLVLLNGNDGSVISMDAKSLVANDPYGLQFPWRSKSSQLFRLLVPGRIRSLFQEKVFNLKHAISRLLRRLNPLNVFRAN
jgi:thiol-disulfide isomerase/thioredoxin